MFFIMQRSIESYENSWRNAGCEGAILFTAPLVAQNKGRCALGPYRNGVTACAELLKSQPC
jgi:hypothetical protein